MEINNKYELRQIVYLNKMKFIPPQKETCPVCGGLGVIVVLRSSKEYDCFKCDGSGFVPGKIQSTWEPIEVEIIEIHSSSYIVDPISIRYRINLIEDKKLGDCDEEDLFASKEDAIADLKKDKI